ncbi:hypothetical protein B4U79_06284 [Dinothrombium tinctorium]|uniref:Galactokinase-like protein n=1 Tax=Dinothrombium tinctorium TaxID=1965070 RepID=A0A3S3RYJ9_9ACAR|nr:hypothetical protein B4U79_13786 [Dinothrombium tinctorium]RWS05302.1 hypothetical protein B4U79_03421 [Dinothrombium tinctorium]RWS06628.1 hypothetical protein B4U79_09288 [Dinothrombium tinctorium]RWS06632.1 hypothetical protein B4U79_06284 [Dinothrombium tinctorium]
MSVSIDSKEKLIANACNAYEQHFGKQPQVFAVASGRINLIGEHVDYNDGFVLPMAIPLYTVVVGSKNDTETCSVLTMSSAITETREVQFNLNDLRPDTPRWANYLKGVIAKFPAPVSGFNAVITSSIPLGCGLSSSAALEVSFFTFLERLTDANLTISLKEKAELCQKAEQEYADVPCGIMDQLISFMGKEDHALLIDCRTLETEFIPISDSNIAFLVCNSNVRHSLAESEYSNRRKACEQVASMLGKRSLRDVSIRELETSVNVLTPEMYQFARYVITEIWRTQNAVDALKKQEYKIFGTLMTQSHCSLRDDYKVSCVEIDELVEAALECSEVYGSRMTGGGFGGCTISLVQSDKVDKVIEHIQSKSRVEPQFFVVHAVGGSQHGQLSESRTPVATQIL